MIEETVTVTAGGRRYSRWESVTVTAGAEQAARAFAIVTAEPDQAFGDDWVFKPGTAVEIYAGSDLLLKGYVDEYDPQFSDTQHTATITGRSKSKDAIDSSAVHPTGELRDKTLKDIAADLDKFGIGFAANVDLKSIPVHRIVPGATMFEELEVLARAQGLLLVGEADGSVMITRAGESGRHAGGLIEGVNIKEASASLSERNKHSKVTARGQKSSGTGKGALRLEHEAEDGSVERYRPLIVPVEGDTDQGRVQQRADWHVARSAGLSTRASILTSGWRDRDGALWDPKKLVYVESRKLKIAQDMAISSVTFEQQNQMGTTSRLQLVDPRALGGKNPKGKSNGAWSAPSPPPAAPSWALEPGA